MLMKNFAVMAMMMRPARNPKGKKSKHENKAIFTVFFLIQHEIQCSTTHASIIRDFKIR